MNDNPPASLIAEELEKRDEKIRALEKIIKESECHMLDDHGYCVACGWQE